MDMRAPASLYRPPAPHPVSPTRALLRAIVNMERDLITLLPADAYRTLDFRLGHSRRGIYMLSDPATVKRLMAEPAAFPKNDLMVGALAPLVGDGIFVSGGATWERQRRMIDPAFGHMRVAAAFPHMAASWEAQRPIYDRAAEAGETLSLEAEMSRLTADIMLRTTFSEAIGSDRAERVFAAFARFQKACAQVELRRLLLGRAWEEVPQPAPAREAAAEIRGLMGAMVDARIGAPEAGDDIARDVILARDPETGEGFTREELIDQLGVFFLAGHETTASALTWAVFILSQQPGTLARLRAEVEAVAGAAPLEHGQLKRLSFTRNVFREALRLYPPVTFLARVALDDVRIGALDVPKGAMLLISPWVIHRHEALWQAADRFDPDRFAPGREDAIRPGTYLPYGQGPRVCVGATFAQMEASLILGELLRRYDVEIDPKGVRPVARLTTRPARDIPMRLVRRGA